LKIPEDYPIDIDGSPSRKLNKLRLTAFELLTTLLLTRRAYPKHTRFFRHIANREGTILAYLNRSI